MPSVAVIGTRGYPSYYGGFETAVRKLSPYLADNGWEVTVYGRPNATKPDDAYADGRVVSRLTRGVETRSLSTLSYGLSSSVDAARNRPDVALVMNVANGFYLPLLRARGIPTLVNVDGIEWERDKWSPLGRRVFRAGAVCAARWADGLVFDARAIETYWRNSFGVDGIFIPYGGDVPPPLEVPLGLTHRGYVLVVARFVPENTVPEFFKAVRTIASKHAVVIVGSSGYDGELDEAARNLAAQFDAVSWLGHVNNDELLLALWQHAGVYFHGHSVGGTNPALVQAMAAGAPILARDTVFNREVLGPTGHFVAPDRDAICDQVFRLMSCPEDQGIASSTNRNRAAEHYSWIRVCADYERALSSLIRG